MGIAAARRFRSRVVTAAAAAMVLASVAIVSVSASGSGAVADRQNVVVIMTDDQSFTELAFMPKTQSLLAAQGTTFENFSVTTSLCCPSRATFLSGQYNHNNRVTGNDNYTAFAHANTIAAWLQGAGYRTGLVGKYMNGYSCAKAIPSGWSHWQGLCANVQNQYNYTINDGGTLVPYGSTAADYQTDVIAGRAVDTIGEFSASGDPFLLYLSPTAPHGPIQVPARYATALGTWTYPLRGGFDEADVGDKPSWIQAKPRLTNAQKSSIQTTQRGRMRMLLAVDDLVERVVNALSANGQLDNTVIIFTSDNGFMRGEHRIVSGKMVLYEESTRVPLVMRGPGIPAGAVTGALAGNVDLAPTIAAIAGVTPGRVVDGRDLRPLLTDPNAYGNRVMLHFKRGVGGTVPVPRADAVRTTSGLKYVFYEGGVEELYDLAIDPFELLNVASDPGYASVKADLAGVLAAMKVCKGTGCHLQYPVPPPPTTTTTATTTTTTTTTTTLPPDTTTTTLPPEETTTTLPPP